jgi:hypothetical protein
MGANHTMSTLDPMEERAAATILVEATDASVAAADPRVSAFLQSCSELLGREAATIMDLRWRQEVDADEVSTRLSIPVEWVDDQVAMIPALYGNMVRSRILWFGGQPKHDELAAQLAAAGMTTFDATTSRTILAHARSCEICDDHTSMRIEPVVAFRNTTPPAAQPLAPVVTPPAATTPSSAAAARIAAATAAGSAAAAATAASASGASAVTANTTTPPPTGPRLAPVGGNLPYDDSDKKKKLLIGGVIGAVVIVLLAGFLLTRGGSKSEDVATGDSPTTVKKEVYETTASTAATTTTTRAPTTTTTEAPPVPDAINATINGGPTANVPQGFPTSSANINWTATIAPPPANVGNTPTVNVTISGAGVSNAQLPQNGSISVCPSAETDICNVVPGTYAYTLTLFRDGVDVASTTVTLIVDPPPPPPEAPAP